MLRIYTKVKLDSESKDLIYNGINRIGLDKYLQQLNSCNCDLVPKNNLHITIKNTVATSIDHIKQAMLPKAPFNVNTLDLSERSIEQWDNKYSAFHKLEMPEKLCKKLLYIAQNIEFKVDDYSAHFGRFAVVTLSAIDNNRAASYLENNPHISIVKCVGNNAQTCLNKVDKIKIDNYKSIFDIVAKNTLIKVSGIEINADIYGESHETIMSKNIEDCKKFFKKSWDEEEAGTSYIPFFNDKDICLADKIYEYNWLDESVGYRYTPPMQEPGIGVAMYWEGSKPAECFKKGTVIKKGESIGEIKFGLVHTFKQIEDALGVEISSPISYDRFLLTPAINYAKNLKQTEYSISSVFYSKYTLPTKVYEHSELGEAMLNDFGLDIYEKYPEDFIRICGDSVIKEMQMAAVFIAHIKVISASKTQHNNFISKINDKIPEMDKVMLEYSNIADIMGGQGTIEISAFQIGGDHTQLSEIFGSGHNDQYGAVKCSFDNSDACKDVVRDILAYEKKFSSQLKENPEGGVVTGLVPLKVSDFLFSAQLREYTVDEEHTAYRKYLSQQHDKLLQREEVLEKITSSNIVKGNISSSAFQKLGENLNKVKNLINELEDGNIGAIQCYKPDGDCRKVVRNTKKGEDLLDNDFLNSFSVTYNVEIKLAKVAGYFFGSTMIGLWPVEMSPGAYSYANPEKSLKLSLNPNNTAKIDAAYECPLLIKYEDDYRVKVKSEDLSECLCNWYPLCEYIHYEGELLIQQLDILDQI